MGGYGSTRWGWHSTKNTVESCKRLRIRELLSGSGWRWYSWTIGGRDAGKIGYLVRWEDSHPVSVQLSYTFTESKESLDYTIPITRTLTSWGSPRYWFRCMASKGSGPVCGRRVGVLYLPPGGRYFACRHCYDLTYAACQESHSSNYLASLITPKMLDNYPGMTLAEVAKLIECRFFDKRIPPRLQKLADRAAYTSYLQIMDRLKQEELARLARLESAQRDRYADYLTAAALCEKSGLQADDLAGLESARLLLPDRGGLYRPKLAGWAGKLAYLLREGWELQDIAAWARGRWTTPNPRRWPPNRADWSELQ